MSIQETLGALVILVGLIMMGVATVAAWREARTRGHLGAAADFVDSLARLVAALADQRTSVVLFTFGTLLVFLGGLILGVTALTG